MTFVCHKEINCKKSKVLQAFAGVNSIEKFGKLYLPISGYQQRGQIHRGHVEVNKELKEGNIIDNISILFEIDLSQLNSIKKALGLNKLDCYPLTWCYQELRT